MVYSRFQWLTRHRFVDRDMFMRHVGGGVGHCSDPRVETYEDDVSEDDDMDISNDTSVPIPDHEDIQDDEQVEGNCSNDEDEEDEENEGQEQQSENDDDDDLGPEDGEDDSDGDGDLDPYDAL